MTQQNQETTQTRKSFLLGLTGLVATVGMIASPLLTIPAIIIASLALLTMHYVWLSTFGTLPEYIQ